MQGQLSILESTSVRRVFDLLDVPILGRFLRWRHARTAMQLPLFALALLMIWDGFTGPQLAPKNLATVLTWLHYRGLIVLVLLVAGNIFCMACPFMLPRNLARRFFRPVRAWPRRLRNKWTAALLFVLFLFVYEYFDLWATPWWTAWLIVLYFAGALLTDSLFRGAPFCKYICPVGQFNLIGSLVSPLEVKVRERDLCVRCRSKDCIRGRDDQRGCELWLFQQRKEGNMDCTFCLDCIHACPYDNVGISTRLPGSELWSDRRRSGIGRFSRRTDLAVLVTVFTFGALINAFGMVSPVYVLEKSLTGILGTHSEIPVLGFIFAIGLVIEPAVLLGTAGWLTQRWAKQRASVLRVITRYAYALVPLGFGVWLAHYAFHFLTGFWTVVPITQKILVDMRLPILGPANWSLGAVVPRTWLLPLELGFIGLGCSGSLLIAFELARRHSPARIWQAFLPWATLALFLATSAVWLMLQPMEMRGTFLGAG